MCKAYLSLITTPQQQWKRALQFRDNCGITDFQTVSC